MGRDRPPVAVVLEPYRGWEADGPHANFKREVAEYTLADPLETLTALAASTGIPVGSLVRP